MRLWYGLKLAKCVFVEYEASQLLLIPGFGTLRRSYKVICRWLPHVLGLEAVGRVHTVSQGLGPLDRHCSVSYSQLLLVWGLWTFERFCRAS